MVLCTYLVMGFFVLWFIFWHGLAFRCSLYCGGFNAILRVCIVFAVTSLTFPGLSKLSKFQTSRPKGSLAATMTMPITFVSDCSIETYTESKEREHSRKHEQATCVTITFLDGAMINLIKNTDGEYFEEMKTFKIITLTPNKQGHTLERHPAKKNKNKNKSWENRTKLWHKWH